ncbi:MAG: hypothetical protein ACM3JJ_07710 [Hyphomicrobiales bacterium]
MALLAALAGCAAESQLLTEDPGFTAASLREGGLAVLGVVQVNEVAQVRPPLIAGLESVLHRTRPDLRIVPASRVEAALPDTAYRYFLLGYQMRGDPDSLWLAVAAKAARGMARYGVLARVETASVRYGMRYVDTGTADRRSGREIPVSGRDARIAVDVYDLNTRLPVFRGRFIGSSDEARNLAPRPEASEDSLPVPRRPAVEGDPGDGSRVHWGPPRTDEGIAYPDAPPVSRAAEAAFLSFVRALPGSEPPPATGGR